MKSSVAATMIASGAFLMVVPAAALLAFAEPFATRLGDIARLAHVGHVFLCTLVGFFLIVLGATRARE
jgi:uncharacterized Tic20 family protein